MRRRHEPRHQQTMMRRRLDAVHPSPPTERLLVFLLRHKIFAALARDSRELIVTHPIRVNYGFGGLQLLRHDRCYL